MSALRILSSSRRVLASPCTRRSLSVPAYGQTDLFNPTADHKQLRELVRNFVVQEVDPQALQFNRREEFNLPLFKKLGDLGLLGVTVDPQYGGSGMDATAAVIIHEELAASDPAFCLSYLAHSMLFVNNLSQNGSHDQKLKFLPRACSGEIVGGMGMSEPGAGTGLWHNHQFHLRSGGSIYIFCVL